MSKPILISIRAALGDAVAEDTFVRENKKPVLCGDTHCCHPEPGRRDRDHGRSADLASERNASAKGNASIAVRGFLNLHTQFATARSLAVCAAREDIVLAHV